MQKFISIAALLLFATACSVTKEPPPVATPAPNCNGYAIGSIRRESCPAGETGSKVYTCTADGWVGTSDDCRGSDSACNKTVFNRDVKPIIQSKCIACHQTFLDYGSAKTVAAEMARRVNLNDGDRGRMPLYPKDPLPADQKRTFNQWLADGLIQDVSDPACNTNPPPPQNNLDLSYVETTILNDLNRQTNATTRLNRRYLVLSHKADLGLNAKALNRFLQAINKGLNGLSTAVDLFTVAAIDANQTIFRFDLRDYGLNAVKWALVENKEPLNFESFTGQGLQIKALTGTRKAWLHAENFLFTSHGGQDPNVYYDILGVPVSILGLQAQLGVDFAGSQKNDIQAHFLGFFGSSISLNKNRLLVRVPSRDGYYWQTFDTNSRQLATKNLFQFPLLADSGGVAVYTPDASEVIFTLPNKLQGYALFNAAGVRQNAAPLDVVYDNQTPFDPTITTAFSCVRCHNQGIIPAVDQIRDHVKQNGAQFLSNDVALVDALYRPGETNAATFTTDNAKYGKALTQVGVQAVDLDPMSYAMDSLRKDQSLADVASLFFMTEDQFRVALNSSAVGRLALGQLLSGGTVGFVQLTAILPQLILDIRFGQDALGADTGWLAPFRRFLARLKFHKEKIFSALLGK